MNIVFEFFLCSVQSYFKQGFGKFFSLAHQNWVLKSDMVQSSHKSSPSLTRPVGQTFGICALMMDGHFK